METITTIEELVESLIKYKITMVSENEFNLIINNYENISKIDGDIIECGVWRGGFSIFLSHLFQDRNIWVCDSFEGFQPLEKAKHQYDKERHTPEFTYNFHGPIGISLEEVKNCFKIYGLENEERIKFLKGFVKDSLPTCGIEKISLLRVDVDAYSATLEVLEELYDKVQPGGYIIFDDSCLIETLDAIKFFFSKKNIDKYLIDPITNKKLNLNQSHIASDSGFPAGCYIIKNENNI
jgi:O-methyltransferase